MESGPISYPRVFYILVHHPPIGLQYFLNDEATPVDNGLETKLNNIHTIQL